MYVILILMSTPWINKVTLPILILIAVWNFENIFSFKVLAIFWSRTVAGEIRRLIKRKKWAEFK